MGGFLLAPARFFETPGSFEEKFVCPLILSFPAAK